jgi:hypothetical protein
VEDYEWAHLPGAATVAEGTPAGEALRLRDAQGFGPVLVLNQAGVVMGAAYRNALGKDTTVGRDHKHICLAARTRRGRLVGGRADMACWYRDGRWFGADAAAGSPA